MNITELLTSIYTQYKFSDLHLHANESPIVRIDGDLQRVNIPALTKEQVHELLYQIMPDKTRKDFEKNLEIDFSYDVDKLCRFRVNVYLQTGNIGGVFRAIPYQIKTIDELGLPTILKSIASNRQGLVLVTGQKGSGKSTTLAAMLEYLNTTVKKHIVTIEDPIEYVYENKKSLFSQRQVNSDTHSFAAALRSALREDADIILVGEIRDLETIRL